MADPRLYQIGTLAALLVYGMGWLEFDITPVRAALTRSSASTTRAPGPRTPRTACTIGTVRGVTTAGAARPASVSTAARAASGARD